MNKEQILSEINSSKWQPKFEFTDNLNSVVDNILEPHEDYFLKLHDKVKEIIEREIEYAKTVDNYRITFADVCNWQKELFKHKLDAINGVFDMWVLSNLNQWIDEDQYFHKWNRANELPNQHINLGLRTINVKVSDWTPPAPIFLEYLKEMCFPISNESVKKDSFGWFLQGISLKMKNKEELHFSSKELNDIYLLTLENWYKTFQTIHFFEDLNGRIGGIVINILSYLLTNKYLTKNDN